MEEGQSLMKVEEKTVFLFGGATEWGFCLQGLSESKEPRSPQDGWRRVTRRAT